MTSNVPNPVSAEEIAVALDSLGQDASTEHIREVAALIDPQRKLDGDRAQAVQAEVDRAWGALQSFAGNQARTMDQGKVLLDDALKMIGATRTDWEACADLISPWEYCRVKFGEAGLEVSVGVSAGGVVSVEGDPFTPDDRRLNVEFEPVVASLQAARDRHLAYAKEGAVLQRSPHSFAPTVEMLHAAEDILLAEAVVKAIVPVVDAYQRRILVDGQWKGSNDDRVILDPKLTYHMRDEDFAEYDRRCNDARKRAGLWVASPEYCPKLVAENDLRTAKRKLIDAMQPITGVDADGLLCLGMKEYDRYVDLSQKLLARYVDSARVKQRFAAWRAEREPQADASPEI